MPSICPSPARLIDTSGVQTIVSAGSRARRLSRRLIVFARHVDPTFAYAAAASFRRDDVDVRACFGVPRCPTMLANGHCT
jgi:hypothetical protein